MSILFASTFVQCTHTPESNINIIASNTFLVGNWKGIGAFSDQNHTGPLERLAVEVNIYPQKLHVTIGNREVKDPQLHPTKYGFEIKGELPSTPTENDSLKKDKVILLLVISQTATNLTKEIDANVHLKNTFGFDYSMKVGGVKLAKAN
jgi:hypothetical protein